MNADINRNITSEIPHEDFSIDFETERTPVRLGKSERYFYMDFNDVNFPNRFMKARKDIADFLESKRESLEITNLSDIQAKEYTTEEIEETMVLSKEIDNYIKSKVNEIFGYDVSTDVFGIASAASVTKNGEYYFDNFLNALLPLVEREYGIRIKSNSEKIKQYTDRKGTHPALKK